MPDMTPALMEKGGEKGRKRREVLAGHTDPDGSSSLCDAKKLAHKLSIVFDMLKDIEGHDHVETVRFQWRKSAICAQERHVILWNRSWVQRDTEVGPQGLQELRVSRSYLQHTLPLGRLYAETRRDEGSVVAAESHIPCFLSAA